MKRIGQIILSLLGVAVLAMAFSLAVPRAVHSQLASPAQVANFPNNPVPVMNVNDPGRKPYFATSGTTTSANCTDTFTCQFSFVPVPAGERLVVQHVALFIQANSGSAATVYVGSSSGAFGETFVAATVAPVALGGSEIALDQPVLVYLDAGVTPLVRVQFPTGGVNTSDTMLVQQAVLSGYLLDCAAAPCSAIVTQ